MVDSKYSKNIIKINIGTAMWNPEMSIFVPHLLKSRTMCKRAIKNYHL